jgi:Ni,Fe-hydrogenase III large subunit
MKRLIARYAVERSDALDVVTVYDTETLHERCDSADPVVHSIAPKHPAAIWFERKMADDFGLRIEGAFDRRPLLHHERWPQGIHPMRKAFDAKTELDYADFRPYRYEAIGGDGVFEVAVGPIHAGIIEPGHFQFSQAGEDMLHQEVRHFYKYRGIEKMLEGKRPEAAVPVIARISGNESIAAQIAWRDILTQASEGELPDFVRARDALLLELERVIHHLTDLGFIANDAGFAAALAWGSKSAEEARRLMARLTGHRFGFDAIFKDLEGFETVPVREWIAVMEEEIAWFGDWITDIPSLWDRFDTTGILRPEKARKYAAVGVVARASGVPLDVRDTPWYRERGYEMITEEAGDVGARFRVRLRELAVSLRLMRTLLEEAQSAGMPIPTVRDGEYTAFVESSLGELFMTAIFEEGRVARFFMRDPSFVNWQALHLMMPGNIIADFPLINKSCDLSYAGNDL